MAIDAHVEDVELGGSLSVRVCIGIFIDVVFVSLGSFGPAKKSKPSFGGYVDARW